MAATEILVRDYDLAVTLASGQVFRWQRVDNFWHGVQHSFPVPRKHCRIF